MAREALGAHTALVALHDPGTPNPPSGRRAPTTARRSPARRSAWSLRSPCSSRCGPPGEAALSLEEVPHLLRSKSATAHDLRSVLAVPIWFWGGEPGPAGAADARALRAPIRRLPLRRPPGERPPVRGRRCRAGARPRGGRRAQPLPPAAARAGRAQALAGARARSSWCAAPRPRSTAWRTTSRAIPPSPPKCSSRCGAPPAPARSGCCCSDRPAPARPTSRGPSTTSRRAAAGRSWCSTAGRSPRPRGSAPSSSASRRGPASRRRRKGVSARPSSPTAERSSSTRSGPCRSSSSSACSDSSRPAGSRRSARPRSARSTCRSSRPPTRTSTSSSGRDDFREDLYWRLAEITVRVPTLDRRRADIRGFADLFLRAARQRFRRPEIEGFAEEATPP